MDAASSGAAAGGGTRSSGRSAWSHGARRLRKSGTPRTWAVEANDGIIATAGLLEGFAGAGAGDSVLFTAAAALTIAGSLGLGGAKWAEEAAERDAQAALIAEERTQLATSPDDEVGELAEYWERKGLDDVLARRVAESLSAHDALAAHLEYEHGITAPMPAWLPASSGVFAALSYVSGAAVPLAMTILLPVGVEVWAIAVVVLCSLVLTSVIAARTSHVSAMHYAARSVAVGAATMAISYLAGTLLL